jgi:HK97 family phage major capsid protein
MSENEKVRRFPRGVGGWSHGRQSMSLSPEGGGGDGGDDAPIALMEERVEVADDESAQRVILEGRQAFNRLAKQHNTSTARWKEKETEFETRLREVSAKNDTLDTEVKRLGRSAPEWKLEDGSLKHVAKRLVAPKGIDQSYFNATVLLPEEMRYFADLSGSDAVRAADPFQRVWDRKFKVTDELRFLIEELHALGDTLLFADIALAGRNEATHYGRLGSYAQRIKSLPMWEDYQKVAKDVQRAMAGATATQGAEWVPYFMSANLKLMVQAATQVANLFQEITMPTPKYDNPVEGIDPVVYLIGEATADNESTNVITADTPKTSKMTLTAVKLALRILLSSEIVEDSIINVASDVLRRIAKAFARGMDETIINGDTAGTHQDSDVTNAKDRRKAWDGLRKQALISNMPNVDLAAFTSANLLSIRKAMGVYGSRPADLAWIVGFKGMIEMMKLAELVTMEKYGNNASVILGEVAKFFGSPVVLSEFIREDLNASAVFDNSVTTKTCLLCVNRESFARGERRAITLNSSNDRYIETDQTVVVGTWRGDFKPWYTTAAAANKTVGIGRNFS